jgi:hypothetical protein
MAKMTTAVATNNLGALHAKCVVHMALHSSGNGVKVGRPATARLELVVRRIERGIASSAIINALGRVMGVIFSCTGSLGTLLAEYTELLCIRVC